MTDEVARGEWLRQRMGAFGTVTGVAGGGFARYARVLHPIGAHRLDLTSTDRWGQHPVIEETTWPWREIARRNGKTMHPLVQWRRITDDERALDFDDGWRAGQSEEGWLDPALMAVLTEHLACHTERPDDLVAGIWHGWGTWSGGAWVMQRQEDDGTPVDVDEEELAHLQREADARNAAAYSPAYLHARTHGPTLACDGRDYLLFETSTGELADPRWGYGAGIGWQEGLPNVPVPQLLWPGDRAWVVATEIDWDSTIVAGSSDLIDAVLTDSRFEAFEIDAGADLSCDGDTINS